MVFSVLKIPTREERDAFILGGNGIVEGSTTDRLAL